MMRTFGEYERVVYAGLIVAGLSSCGGDSGSSWGAVFQGPACDNVSCLEEPGTEFGLGGVWVYGNDCQYVSAGPDAQDQIGLGCSGELRLCYGRTTDDFTWHDSGPNGVGIGEGFEALGAAVFDNGGGPAFTVFGNSRVEAQGCTSVVRVVLGCESIDGTLGYFHCQKFSGILSSSCSELSSDYWVVSDFTFSRTSIECGL
jgi:hypothetical protein